MTKLSVLHLSDLHFSMKKWPDARLIIDALIHDIMVQREAGMQPDMCIFSGDLFQAGGKNMPKGELLDFVIKPVLSAAGLSSSDLFVCVGNHDIDREVVRDAPAIQKGMLATLTDRDALNAFYDTTNSSPDAVYFQRLVAFQQFCEPFGSDFLVMKNPFVSVYKRTLANGMTVGLASFNTSWLSTGEEGDIDRGKLFLPERSIHDAIRLIDKADLRIAVHHHPLDYLADFCRFDARALLHKHFNLICYGHMHQAMPLLTRSVIGDAVSSEAGALYTWRNYYNGYCYITIDKDNRTVTFLHRKWEDSPAYRFVNANELTDDGISQFVWGTTEQVTISKSVLDINKRLRPVIEANANDHMLSTYTNTNAPKTFSQLFVEPPLTVRVIGDTDPFSQPEYLTVSELLNEPQPDLVYGNREAGKTSLSFKVALSVCEVVDGPPRIPVLIDTEKSLAKASVLRREAQKLLIPAGLADKVDDFLKEGAFVLIIDNFPVDDSRWAAAVNEFGIEAPNVKIIAFCDERGTVFQKVATDESLSKARSVSLHPLKRKEVRELTKRWLAPSGLYSQDAFHAVLKKIQHSGLPTTAYVVSMIAWTLERQNLNTNINEASLLERFVDAILNKADQQEVSRASLDYTIRETFLSEVSFELRKNSTFTISLSDLDQLAVGFINARGWITNGADFVRELIATGILVEVDNVVSFRYRCLREYFLAKYINDDEDYREIVSSEENFLEFSRELDILTGLRRKDKKLLEKIYSYTEKRVSSGLEVVDLKAFETIGFRFGAERTMLARPKSLSDLGLNDEVVEEILDSADAQSKPSQVAGDLEPEKPEHNRKRLHDLSAAYQSITLLAKVVRNSELITDMDLKTNVTHSVLLYWAQFIGYVVTSFDKAVDDTQRADHEKKVIDRLTDDQLQFVEHFVKIIIPLIFSGAIHSCLGTEKLRSIFEQVVEDKVNQPLLVRLLTAFLLIDVSFIDRSNAANEMIKKVDTFAKEASSRLITELISEKLLHVYNTPNLGDQNRQLIERLYAEAQLRVHGVNTRSPAYGSQKSNIVRAMREKASAADAGEGVQT